MHYNRLARIGSYIYWMQNIILFFFFWFVPEIWDEYSQTFLDNLYEIHSAWLLPHHLQGEFSICGMIKTKIDSHHCNLTRLFIRDIVIGFSYSLPIPSSVLTLVPTQTTLLAGITVVGPIFALPVSIHNRHDRNRPLFNHIISIMAAKGPHKLTLKWNEVGWT